MSALSVAVGTVTRTDVASLADGIEAEDGAPPLSDQALTRIGAPDGVDLVVRDSGELVGYARLDGSDLEIVGRTHALRPLLDAAVARGGDLQVWSHGTRSRLVAVLEEAGFVRTRELYQLRRPLRTDDLPADPALPDAVRVRASVPGEDDSAWLALNAAAFAHHAEQGGWTQADLDAREAEAWFEPAGFLLAERDGTLLAFHWTKIHPDGTGEVYVLGVSPDAQGLGLGGALLIRGLRHLADRGCTEVLLYVDGDNTPAVHLYERDGFRRFDLDIQWRSGEKRAL